MRLTTAQHRPLLRVQPTLCCGCAVRSLPLRSLSRSIRYTIRDTYHRPGYSPYTLIVSRYGSLCHKHSPSTDDPTARKQPVLPRHFTLAYANSSAAFYWVIVTLRCQQLLQNCLAAVCGAQHAWWGRRWWGWWGWWRWKLYDIIFYDV